jgi:hypothetical protein
VALWVSRHGCRHDVRNHARYLMSLMKQEGAIGGVSDRRGGVAHARLGTELRD